MSMTNSIYDVELYSTSFLFSYEEYLSVKSRTELPLICSHCGKTFYRQKKEITRGIKKNKLNFYCCKECSNKGNIKPKEETTHTCKFCGKEFTELPSKYASGDFAPKIVLENTLQNLPTRMKSANRKVILYVID